MFGLREAGAAALAAGCLLSGCVPDGRRVDGDGARGKAPPPPPAARPAEERLAEDYLRGRYGPSLTVEHWGPHDLEGRLAAEVQTRRKEGWTRWPTRWHHGLLPGTRIVAVRFRHVDGTPGRQGGLVFVRDGRPLEVAFGGGTPPMKQHGDAPPPRSAYRQTWPLGLPWDDDWLELELAKLRALD